MEAVGVFLIGKELISYTHTHTHTHTQNVGGLGGITCVGIKQNCDEGFEEQGKLMWFAGLVPQNNIQTTIT